MKKAFFLFVSIIAFTACEKQLDYVEGEIIVAFEETITNTEAESVIENDLNLVIQKWITDEPNTKIVLVDVPEGEEANWITTAEQNSSVKYAELNRIVTID